MSKEFCERVGRNIKKYRTLSDMTLKELADKLELDEAQLIKMYSQLTTGHKRAVRCLIKELLACQEK